MKSINFAEATHVLGVAQGYQPLAVLRTEENGNVINNSYWKPTGEEIALLQAGHAIHLGILGSQPPVLLGISNIKVEEIPYTNEHTKAAANPEPAATKLYAADGVSFKEKMKCAVCDGTGFKDGATGGDEACRFCNGGYLDAAN